MIKKVKAKKQLGQHFLINTDIAIQIVESLNAANELKKVLEIGPGMGVLTQHLLANKNCELKVVEIDTESVEYLKATYPELKNNIIEGDFLQLKLNEIYNEQFAIIGNFPYNISSQILFKVLEYKNLVPQVVGMFQKEVAERIASKSGKKSNGIITIFLQAYFDIEYLFTVDEFQFDPPPKVKSAVIRLTRNKVEKLNCDEVLFKEVVKTAFNQRRKIMRNALKSFFSVQFPEHIFFSKRAEQLGVDEFVELTNLVEKYRN